MKECTLKLDALLSQRHDRVRCPQTAPWQASGPCCRCNSVFSHLPLCARSPPERPPAFPGPPASGKTPPGGTAALGAGRMHVKIVGPLHGFAHLMSKLMNELQCLHTLCLK